MILIKSKSSILNDDIVRLIKFYRQYPIAAVRDFLRRDGEPIELAPVQQKIFMDWYNAKFSMTTASRGSGKSCVNGTKVLTEKGWINIECLTLDDKVITPKGNKVRIEGIYPQGYLPTYKLKFEDGRSSLCSHDHLWAVKGSKQNNDTWLVVTASMLKEWYRLSSENRVVIPLVEDVFNSEEDRIQTLHTLDGFFNDVVSYGICRTTSLSLAKQVQQDIWKVGGISRIEENMLDNEYTVSYEEGKEGLELISIEETIQQECTCIKIDDPDGLFIIDDYVVTHNTFLGAVYIAIKSLLYPNSRSGIFAPSFRQSKFIFNEFKLIYENSPLLQECVNKEPTLGNEKCVCEFKPAGRGVSPSYVEALPVGSDGSKIRGKRFSKILLDECVQLPEVIFRASLRPMLSTSRNPMQKVREIERLKKLYNLSEIPDDLLASENGYIAISSGYYQFNYWWPEILKFWLRMQSGDKNYSLRFVPYHDLPPGFFDLDIVKDSELNDPRHMFLTEWCAEWISDSEGVFPMSLLESARDNDLIPKPKRDSEKDKNKNYVLGIDIGRENDATAISVIELGYPNRLVWLAELENVTFQEQAKTVLEYVNRFNPLRIYMDAGGGGLTVRDLVGDPESLGLSRTERIIEVDKDTNYSGKRILVMCDFTPNFIEDANNNTKVLLEQGVIKVPTASHPIEVARKHSKKGVKEIDLVQEMINQTSAIVITKTGARGLLHYDLPRASAKQYGLDVRRKDLYTSFILACKCAYDLEYKPKVTKSTVQQGVIREVNSNNNLTAYEANVTIFNRQVIGSYDDSGVKKILQGGIVLPRGTKKKR